MAVSLEKDVDACEAVLNDNTINDSSLDCVYTSAYDSVKQNLRVKGDFCIFLEDENGQIIAVNNRNSFGSAELLVGGAPCGT